MPEGSEAPGKRRTGSLTAGAVALALCAGVILGPRARVGPDVPPFDLTLSAGEVDAYLTRQEGRFNDLTPGTRKSVVWAGEPGERTPLALVYLHGFSATSMETRPLPERVAKGLGANLFRTRFNGHGRPGQALAEATAEDWLVDVAEAMAIGRALGDRTVLLGTSTGGTLALWAATRPRWKGEVPAVILISANLGPRDSRAGMLLWPWGGLVARAVVGPERSWEPTNPDHGRFWTTRYPTEALLPMMALVDMVRGVPSSDLEAPVLSLFSPHDRVVAPEEVDAWASGLDSLAWRSSEVVGSDDPDQHVLAGDILSPGTTAEVEREIRTFLESVLQGSPSGQRDGDQDLDRASSRPQRSHDGGTVGADRPL